MNLAGWARVGRRSYGVWTGILWAGCAAALTVWLGGVSSLDGPLLDALVWARAGIAPTEASLDSPVAVIALDQRSVDDPELQEYPRALLAPVWTTVLDAVVQAGARTVGFDVLFSYSASRFSANYDAAFLATLGRYADRVVLARTATTLPARPYLAALRFDKSGLGLAELVADPDGTYRRVRATYETVGADQGEALLSLSNALLRRAGVSTMPAEVVIAPAQHPEALPTYALIDVLRCARTAPEGLGPAFRGKIVLIGSTLPEEDRKRSPAKYLAAPETDAPPVHRCGLRRLGASVPGSVTVPGIFLHAAAVEATLQQRIILMAPPSVVALLASGAAAVGVSLGMSLTPWMASFGLVGTSLLFFAAGAAALASNWWVALALPLLALTGGAVVAYVARYLVEERARRRIQRAFSYYLAPTLVEQLAQDPSALKLGGERREVTVMFADLSGFTKLSTKVPPEVLVGVTNRYLTHMVKEVEASGGYVNQFIGDAVMAIWGAPVSDARHALHAVQAARGIVARVMTAKAEADARGEFGFTIKVGINAGAAVVGNMGAENRCAYTAVGETVNLAARLESVPTLYACRIVIGPTVAKLIEEDFLLRELDWIVVKGKDDPIAVYEPLALRAEATPAHVDLAAHYTEALAYYRSESFAEAAAIWEGLAGLEERLAAPWQRGDRADNPSSKMAERARAFAARPPEVGWKGVWVLTSK